MLPIQGLSQAFFSALFFPFSEEIASIAVLIGAFITAFLGLQCVNFLENKLKVKNDSAFSFILSLFLEWACFLRAGSRLRMLYGINKRSYSCMVKQQQ
jgi:ABC-type Mn2+/Zn2+ transport system permease subunit